MKNTASWLVLAGLLAAGCGMQDDEASEPLIIHVPWFDAVTEWRPGAPAVEPEAPAVEEPVTPTPTTPDGCLHPSLIGAPLLEDASPAAGPTITERFNEAGCVAERHTFRYDAAGRVIEQTYLLLDPTLPPITYVPRISFHQVHEYDAQGNQTLLRRADPETGELLYEEVTTYDGAGRKVHQRRVGHYIDFPSEGVSEERWTYHSSGELEQRESWYNGEPSDSERFVRDAAGAPLERHALIYQQHGAQMSLTDRWSYDHAGRLLTHETTGADGQSATFTQLSYDFNGQLLYKDQTDLRQGWRSAWRYDAEGRELSHQQDEDRDGRPEYIKETTYNLRGDVIRESTSYDQLRGRFYSATLVTYTFDAQGRPTSHRYEHTHRNGWLTSATGWIWDADGAALRTHTNASHDAEARITSRAAVRLSGADTIILWQDHYDQSGAVSYREANTYDAAGRLSRAEQISSAGSFATDYTYDAAGRLVSQQHDPRSPDSHQISRQEWRFR